MDEIMHHQEFPSSFKAFSAMQLLMSVPQLVEVADSGSIWHDAAILACLVDKLFRIFGVTAQLAPFPAHISGQCGSSVYHHTCPSQGPSLSKHHFVFVA